MAMARISALILLACLASGPALAREAGWVPLPDKPWQPPLNSGSSIKPKKAVKELPAPKAVKKGSTVYEGQPPVTEAELGQFINLLPRFRAWARQNREDAHPIVNAKGDADFLYSPKAAQWVGGNKINPARFFCIMGRMATCLVIIEEGNDLKEGRPRDMPAVDPAEVELARRHLGELLTAGGGAAPIK